MTGIVKDPLYSKCGTNCTQCPSYKDNLLTDDDRHHCTQGWYTYHGFRLKPEKLIPCDGCQPIGENGDGTRYISCIIRRCALHNEIETCAHCSAYPCEVLIGRVLGDEWLDGLRKKMGEIPEDDFRIFVEPYLVMPNLEKIRNTLTPGEIMEFKAITIKPRLVAIPQELESIPGLQAVYRLLEEMNAPLCGLTFAQAERQKEKHTHLLTGNQYYTAAGPCTEMCLLEAAAQAVTDTASGREIMSGCASAKGTALDRTTPIESRMMAYAARAVAGMDAEKVNHLLDKLVKHYEGPGPKRKFNDAPFGKRFQDCYDVVTLNPTEEHIQVLGKAMKTMEDIGFEFKL